LTDEIIAEMRAEEEAGLAGAVCWHSVNKDELILTASRTGTHSDIFG